MRARPKLRRKRTYAPMVPQSIIEIQGKPVDYKEIWGKIEQGIKDCDNPEELLIFKTEVDEYTPKKLLK